MFPYYCHSTMSVHTFPHMTVLLMSFLPTCMHNTWRQVSCLILSAIVFLVSVQDTLSVYQSRWSELKLMRKPGNSNRELIRIIPSERWMAILVYPVLVIVTLMWGLILWIPWHFSLPHPWAAQLPWFWGKEPSGTEHSAGTGSWEAEHTERPWR